MKIDSIDLVQKSLVDGASLIDVRELDEWKKGHIEKAKSCPLSLIEKGERFGLSKENTLLIHCRSGGRAQSAQKILDKEGYKVKAVTLSFDELKKHI